jgi:hypothetical protein
MYFILTKNGLGDILGEFFTNSSGHPAFIQNKPPKNTGVTKRYNSVVWLYLQ